MSVKFNQPPYPRITPRIKYTKYGSSTVLTGNNALLLDFSSILDDTDTTVSLNDIWVYKMPVSSETEIAIIDGYTFQFDFPSGDNPQFVGVSNPYGTSQTVKYLDNSAPYYRCVVPAQDVYINGFKYIVNNYEGYLYKDHGSYVTGATIWSTSDPVFTENNSGGYTSNSISISSNSSGVDNFSMIISTNSNDDVVITPLFVGQSPLDATNCNLMFYLYENNTQPGQSSNNTGNGLVIDIDEQVGIFRTNIEMPLISGNSFNINSSRLAQYITNYATNTVSIYSYIHMDVSLTYTHVVND